MAFQAAWNDRHWDNYRHSALSNGRHVGVRAFLYNIVQHLGIAIIGRSTNPQLISGYHVTDIVHDVPIIIIRLISKIIMLKCWFYIRYPIPSRHRLMTGKHTYTNRYTLTMFNKHKPGANVPLLAGAQTKTLQLTLIVIWNNEILSSIVAQYCKQLFNRYTLDAARG